MANVQTDMEAERQVALVVAVEPAVARTADALLATCDSRLAAPNLSLAPAAGMAKNPHCPRAMATRRVRAGRNPTPACCCCECNTQRPRLALPPPRVAHHAPRITHHGQLPGYSVQTSRVRPAAAANSSGHVEASAALSVSRCPCAARAPRHASNG